MFIFNVLPLREFHSPKSQFAMVNVCILLMYYHVLLMYFPWKMEGSLMAKSHYFQISDDRQRTLQNWNKSSRIRSIRPQTPRMTQNSHHFLTHYIVCFRCLTSGRELPKIPTNQTKFAQFAHTSRELHEICAFCTKIHPHLVH